MKSSGISLTGGQWPCRQSRVRHLDVSHLRICPSDHLRGRLTDIGLVGLSTWPLVVNCAVLCLLTREIARIRPSTDCGCRASLDILRQDVKSDVGNTNCASCCEVLMFRECLARGKAQSLKLMLRLLRLFKLFRLFRLLRLFMA